MVKLIIVDIGDIDELIMVSIRRIIHIIHYNNRHVDKWELSNIKNNILDLSISYAINEVGNNNYVKPAIFVNHPWLDLYINSNEFRLLVEHIKKHISFKFTNYVYILTSYKNGLVSINLKQQEKK